MSRKVLLAMLLAGLLVAAPMAARAHGDHDADDAADEEYDDEEDGDSGAAKGGDDEKDVVVIGDKNWTDVVGKSKYALVEFYAPWCGHCQRLKPEYAKAATAVKAFDDTVVVGKVDATVEPEMAKKFGVSGYPTLKWFVDGELVSDYGGPRESAGIANWIKKKTGPPAATISDADALAALEKDNAVLVVGYFKSFKGSEHEAFTKFAQKTEDAAFAQTDNADVAKAAGISSAPGFAVVANHPDEERAAAAGKKVTAEQLESVLKENKLPVVVPFNDKNSPKIFGSGIEKQVLLVAKAADLDLKAGAKAIKAFRSVAAGMRGKLTFVTVDLDSKGSSPVTGFFGVKEEDAPVIVGFEMSANKKYKMTAGDVNTEKAVKKFADDLAAGKLTPEYKSAPVPEGDAALDEGVTVVVGKNFDKVVKDAKKDVLLEVYAPWCGHCKQLAPIYAKLAKRFAKVDSVTIAKMDGTENEHPDVEVKGYPTLIFYPAEKNAKPVSYDGGDRSLKAMTKFIKKHAKIAYELPKKEKKEEGDEGEKKDGGDKEDDEDVKDEL